MYPPFFYFSRKSKVTYRVPASALATIPYLSTLNATLPDQGVIPGQFDNPGARTATSKSTPPPPDNMFALEIMP